MEYRKFPKYWPIDRKVSCNNLIFTSQSAFLNWGLQPDTFVTATELVAGGCKEKVEGVGVNVGFEKAYKMVNWAFLLKL